MTNSQERPEPDVGTRAELGNPFKVLDALAMSCRLLDRYQLPEAGTEERLLARAEFHNLNYRYIKDSIPDEFDLSALETGKDKEKVGWNPQWEKLAKMYGAPEETSPNKCRSGLFEAECERLFKDLQSRLVSFAIALCESGVLSVRGQHALFQTHAFEIPVDLAQDFLDRASDIPGIPTIKTYSPDLFRKVADLPQARPLLEKYVYPEINWIDLAVDVFTISNIEKTIDGGAVFLDVLDYGRDPEVDLAKLGGLLENYRDILLRLSPRSVVAKMSDEDADLLRQIEDLNNSIRTLFEEEGQATDIPSGKLASIIRASGVESKEADLDRLIDRKYSSEALAHQIIPAIEELRSARRYNMHSAVVFLSGNIVENLLMEIMEVNREYVESLVANNKLKFTENSKYVDMDDFRTWRFVQLLKVLKHAIYTRHAEYYNALESFRGVRNYIHGGKGKIEEVHAELGLVAIGVCQIILDTGIGAASS